MPQPHTYAMGVGGLRFVTYDHNGFDYGFEFVETVNIKMISIIVLRFSKKKNGFDFGSDAFFFEIGP